MKRKYGWLLPCALALCLLTYWIGWPWYRDRTARATADALMAQLEEHAARAEQRAGALPPVPDNAPRPELIRLAEQAAGELVELSGQSQELLDRAKEILPGTPENKLDELRASLERYAGRVGRAFDKYGRRRDEIRERASLKAGG